MLDVVSLCGFSKRVLCSPAFTNIRNRRPARSADMPLPQQCEFLRLT
jgi:hypothetical protein